MPASIFQTRPRHGRSRYALSALLVARRRKPNVVVCGHLYHGPLARRIAEVAGAKLVSQLHGTEIWGTLRASHRKALEQSDLVLTVSRDTRARVLAKTNIEPERVVVLNNTVGEDFIPAERLNARASFGIGSEKVVLTVARLDAREGYKGHDLVIREIARLRQTGTNIRYFIAGIGDDQPRLEQLANEQGIPDHVVFVGKVAREDLPRLYCAADVFALPSKGEGFGIAFLEAMASGTPAIGLAVGGAPDALGDGALGVCVSEKEFAPVFQGLINTSDAGRRMRSADTIKRFGAAVFRSRVVAIAERWRAVC